MVLSVRNLQCGYVNDGQFVKALDGLSLDVEEGRIVALMGPSGCGKTTLLKVIAGVLPYQEGDVSLRGKSVENLPIRQRNVSYVFQEVKLFPQWTAFENVAYPLKAHKMKAEEIFRRTEEVAKAVGMYDFLSRKPHQLSLGQQQRILLARSLARDADLYLYDEPFSNLDPPTRRQLTDYLLTEKKRRGMTVLLVTHRSDDAVRCADTLAVMKEGRIIRCGVPAEVLGNFSDAEVAALSEGG